MAQARKSKVLRIAIIEDRKIKQERLIKAGEPVRIGEDPKQNTFVVTNNSVTGPSLVLFQPDGNGYTLRFTKEFGAKSKVSTGGIAAKLHGLMDDSSVTREGDVYSLKLTAQDRGKLDLDGVFVLFQFVAPPPVKAVKPIKAMDFRPRLIEDDDPVFFGFLALWSALALVLSIWVWNSELPEYTLEDIPDRFAVVSKEDIPEPEEDLEIETDEEDPNAAASKKEEKNTEASKSKKPASKGEQAKSVEDTKKQLEASSKLLAKFLATTGDSSAGFVENMWSAEDQGIGDLDKALADNRGGITADADDPGLRAGKGGGGEAAGIGDLSGVTGGGGDAEVGGGPNVVVKASVGMGDGTVSEDIGDKGKLKTTIRRKMGQMKYCYEEELKKNSELQGRVELGWSIYGGKVESVYVVSNTTGNQKLATCMQNKLKRWTFDREIEGDVSWPFVFRPSK